MFGFGISETSETEWSANVSGKQIHQLIVVGFKITPAST